MRIGIIDTTPTPVAHELVVVNPGEEPNRLLDLLVLVCGPEFGEAAAETDRIRELYLDVPVIPVSPGCDGSGQTLVMSEFARHFVDRIPLPLMATDDRGRFLVFNPAAVGLLSCSSDVALSQHHVTDFYADPQEAREVWRALDEAEPGAGVVLNVRLRALSGEAIPVRLNTAAIRDRSGAIRIMIGIAEDLREQIAMAHRFEETTRQLIESERRTDGELQRRSIAHELNQPLTVAMGSLELLAATSGALPPKVLERLDRVYEQLQRMASIIRRISLSSRWGPTGPEEGP